MLMPYIRSSFHKHYNYSHGHPIMPSQKDTWEGHVANPMVREPEGNTGSKKSIETRRLQPSEITVRMSLLEHVTLTTELSSRLSVENPRLDVWRYLTDDNFNIKIKAKCKLCSYSNHLRKLAKHWLRCHAFYHLGQVIKFPDTDHQNLLINSEWKRNIFLAAVYTCPFRPCHTSDPNAEINVFPTRCALDDHLRRWHYLKAANPEAYKAQAKAHIAAHPFWDAKEAVVSEFQSRDYKLVWMLHHQGQLTTTSDTDGL